MITFLKYGFIKYAFTKYGFKNTVSKIQFQKYGFRKYGFRKYSTEISLELFFIWRLLIIKIYTEKLIVV